MKKLMVLDGNSIVNRAFYGVSQNLTTRAGQPTNAIFGFLNILTKLLDEGEPDALCVTFDRKAPTFRHLAYEGYKATRKGMPCWGRQPSPSGGRSKETTWPGMTRRSARMGAPSAKNPPPWNLNARIRSVESRQRRQKLRSTTPSGPAWAGTGKYSRTARPPFAGS